MKIITLNAWGGKLREPIFDFFKKYEHDTDVFCLQEVFHQGTTSLETFKEANMNLFGDIGHILTDFQGYYHPTQTDEEGLAIFVKKTIQVVDSGDVFVFRWRDAMENGNSKTLGRNLQYVSIIQDEKKYLICNFHGLWTGAGKTDTDDRIKQSINITNFLNERKESHKIVLGDFNLRPDTESVKLIEAGMRNLVTEYGIITTRSSMCTRAEIADYVLVSPNIEVKTFQVLPEEVSDHLALCVEI
jgi:endonuclease/exonuclease/phosphatase family metal-dependent hydrolase